MTDRVLLVFLPNIWHFFYFMVAIVVIGSTVTISNICNICTCAFLHLHFIFAQPVYNDNRLNIISTHDFDTGSIVIRIHNSQVKGGYFKYACLLTSA